MHSHRTHPFPHRRPVPSSHLLLTALAGLMILTWLAGRQAGKLLTARSPAAGSGTSTLSAVSDAASGKTAAGASQETVSPEETAALLQATLEAFREYEEVPSNTFNGHWRRARLVSSLAGLSTPKLLALVDALMAETNSREAEEMAGRLLGPILTSRDPARVWAWLRDGAAADKPNYVRFLSGTGSIFSEWAKRDPQAALAAWQTDVQPLVQAGKVKSETLGSIYQSWAATDPAAALSAIEKIPDSPDRLQLAKSAAWSLQKLFEGKPSTWPASADALVNRMLALTGGPAADALDSSASRLPGLGGKKASSGTKLMLASDTLNVPRSENNGPPPGIEAIVSARLAQQTPQETAVWLDSLNANPGQRLGIDKSLADTWMASDPAAAADWYLDRLTTRDPGLRGEALERAIRHWTKAGDNNMARDNQSPPDLAAASEWLIAQGLNNQSQAAMATLAQAWAEAREPAAALAWAQALPDPTARTQALQTITQEIRQRFPNDWQRLTSGP